MDEQDRLTLLMLNRELAALPDDDQAKVKACAAQLRDVLAAAGDHGMMALALVGAETQVMAL